MPGALTMMGEWGAAHDAVTSLVRLGREVLPDAQCAELWREADALRRRIAAQAAADRALPPP